MNYPPALKLGVGNVARGSWSGFSMQPPDSNSLNRNPRREVADQKLIESLKDKAYALAANTLTQSYGKFSATR